MRNPGTQNHPSNSHQEGPAKTETPLWTNKESCELYGTNYWGSGYFRVNSKGHVCVTPQGKQGPKVDLFNLTEDLIARGISTPILVRFPDIIRSRIQSITSCFLNAISEYGYEGMYEGVFPIKVNQQRHVVNEIIQQGKNARLGLECGSKPELLIALGMTQNLNSLIVVNGFKDAEYIETALLSQKMGRKTIVVVDRYSELYEIIILAKKLNMTPMIGFRAKLDAKGAGKWIDSSGAKSKFGLTPAEMVSGVKLLKEHELLNSLQLLHFHIGSQVNTIQAFKTSLKEGARYFAELYTMGAPLRYVDVGGGLGVDYDGTGHSLNSIDYDEQEYANDVVSIIQDTCNQKNIPHPNIITESGRYLVAHHSLLIFDVLGINQLTDRNNTYKKDKADHDVVKDLLDIYGKITPDNVSESYHDTVQLKNDVYQLFSYGYLDLEQRAKAEKIVWSIFTKVIDIVRDDEDYEEIFSALKEEMYDTYFCNFSLFQSIPDAWAVKQSFPIMPIHRLNEEPKNRAVLVDLTCDSDGKIDQFVEYGEEQSTLHLHELEPEKPYYLGAFLLGAYQETLGDLHNLFGDTNAVHIKINELGYSLEHVEEGDSVGEILGYIQYNRSELVSQMRQSIEEAIGNQTISKVEARQLMKNYEEGLAGYTYLEEPE